MGRTDWFPQGRNPLHEHLKGTVGYIGPNAVRFCLDKETPLGVWYWSTFMPEYIKYDDLFATWDNPLTQTPFANDNLKDAEKKIIPLYRELANMLKKSPLVNNGDLEAMNLHKKGPHTHHHAPIADTPPAFYIIAVEGNRLRVFYYPEGARHRKGKPKGQHGVEIKWGFSSVVVINPENLPYSVFDTASPHTLQFSPNDYGKTVYIAMRWENTRGKKGPWSTVMTVNVP